METGRLKLHLIHDAELCRNVTFSRDFERFREDFTRTHDLLLAHILDFYIRSFKCDLYTDIR